MPTATAGSLGERIEKFVADTVTLDVITFTGQVALQPAVIAGTKPTDAKTGADGKITAPATPGTPPKLNFDTLFASVVQQMTVTDDTKLELVAYTHAEWDMDSVNFVCKDPSPSQQKLIEAHQAAVAAAQKSRFEAVKLVAELIGAAVK